MSDHQYHQYQYQQYSVTPGGGGTGSIYQGFGIARGFDNAGYPVNEGHQQFSSGGSSMGESVTSVGTTVSGAQLARRNNTVGASNSRLVRLERNRARIAL